MPPVPNKNEKGAVSRPPSPPEELVRSNEGVACAYSSERFASPIKATASFLRMPLQQELVRVREQGPFYEIFVKIGIRGQLDIPNLSRDFDGLGPLAAAEEGDTGPVTGRIADSRYAAEITFREEADPHGRFWIDVAAEGSR